MTPRTLDVAVVIPALDEEQALPAVLAAVPLQGAGWHRTRIVVADNGSGDRTSEVARAHGAEVVSEPRRGYGAACLAALATLAAAPPDVVLFMDGDGSDDTAQVDALLAPIVCGDAALVIGSRTLGGVAGGALTLVQHAGNALAARLLAWMFGQHATDLGPFRAITWDALTRLRMRDRDYGWTVEMQARAARAALRTVEVPVPARPRAAGRSKVSGTVRGVMGAGWKILTTLVRVWLGR